MNNTPDFSAASTTVHIDLKDTVINEVDIKLTNAEAEVLLENEDLLMGLQI